MFDLIVFGDVIRPFSFETLISISINALCCFPTIQTMMKKLLQKLSEHEWQFNNITTLFSTRYDDNSTNLFYYVYKISSPNFRIYSYTNSVHFYLERMNITFYNNGFVYLTMYIGNDWEHDKYDFWDKPQISAKYYHEPKKYIRYESRSNIEGTTRNTYNYYEEYCLDDWHELCLECGVDDECPRYVYRRFPCELGFDPYLVAEKDKREYDLEPNDIPYYKTQYIIDMVVAQVERFSM